ncbi:MAG: DUF4147 domain-containing protein, partial [bacterium]
MIIKNFERLAKTPLRRDALAIIEAGYEAIAIEPLFQNQMAIEGDILTVHGQSFDLSTYHNIYVVGVGKGSAQAAHAVEQVIGPKNIEAGLVIDIARKRLRKIKSMVGTHPLPSAKNIAATDKIVKILERATAKDLVISLICGGGSALACRPGGLTCLELQFISSVLLRAGATI